MLIYLCTVYKNKLVGYFYSGLYKKYRLHSTVDSRLTGSVSTGLQLNRDKNREQKILFICLF